ncbi:MAG: efflux RND transporter permease subunit, partial [Pseudomonadales bacterium]
FTYNHVAANLLMFIIVVAGLWSLFFALRATLTPQFDSHYIMVTVPYPGAAPQEVEEGIVLKIEQAIEDVSGIVEVKANARDSVGTLQIEVAPEYDVVDLMNEIRSKIDGISSFPEQAERPIIEKLEMVFAQIALQMQVYGDTDERTRLEIAEEIRAELLEYEEITQVEIFGDRPYEVTIEVPEDTLRKYGLTLGAVADAIRRSSVDLPGGSIRTENGDILLRSKDKAYRQFAFEKIVLISDPNGTRLTLGDIATVKDDFEERDGFSYFNGSPSLGIAVMAIGEQDVLEIAEIAKAYAAKKQAQLPQDIQLGTWADVTFYLKGRLGLMVNNLVMGGLLVMLVLTLFMEMKLAFWVIVGLPITFLGTMAALPLPMIDVNMNMISVFGFIVVLGIVVDDAIIIGENVHSTIARDGHSVESVINGARQVAVPATFGVLTTIVAFVPMIMLEGSLAAFPAAVGYVVIFCLIFSLIESKLILPAHLARMRLPKDPESSWQWRLQHRSNELLDNFVERYYKPLLARCIEFRYVTFALFISLLILTFGLIGSGLVRYVMFPDVPGEYINFELEMSEGTSKKELYAAVDKIITSAYRADKELTTAAGVNKDAIENLFGWGENSTSAEFMLEMIKDENFPVKPRQVSTRWRELVGEIPGAKVLSVSDGDPMAGMPIAFLLSGRDIEQLSAAATEVAAKLQTYSGVYDIQNRAADVAAEMNIQTQPEAEALGLSMLDVGRQVRQAFYGEEAQRIQRGRNEVKVMVRYPEQDRKSVATLENMYIRTNTADEVPFSSVANLDMQPGYTSIKRIDYKRAVTILANADKSLVEPSQIMADMQKEFMPELLARYPGISYARDEGAKEEITMLKSLGWGLLFSLFGIYALLAIS